MGRDNMKGDLQVIEYLNKALRHELTAVNQYWLHYRLLDNWAT
jgi:bacterioferritin